MMARMDVREKMVELIEYARYWGSNTSEEIAENLIANGVTVQEWISVNNGFPKDREWVLVNHTGYATPKKAKYKDDFSPHLPVFLIDGDNGNKGEVTHWMPLPPLPKGE